MDLCAFLKEPVTLKSLERKLIPTGLKMELPHGYEAQIRPRSGLSSKGIVSMFGTIDSNYRGEVCAIIQNNSFDDFKIKFGDRICQMKIERVDPIVFEQVEELSETNRNDKGFGSSGV